MTAAITPIALILLAGCFAFIAKMLAEGWARFLDTLEELEWRS